MTAARWRQWARRPAVVIVASLAAALAFALLVDARFEGGTRTFLLYYFTPIGVPFIGLCLDRVAIWPERGHWAWLIDFAVVGLSLLRAGLVSLPMISGHVLFLTYAILSARSPLVRWMAAAVMIQVLYLKLFAWRSSATLVETLVGLAVGCLAAWLERRLAAQRS